MTTTELPVPLATYLNGLSALLPLDEMRTTLDVLEEVRRDLDEQIERLRESIAFGENGARKKYPPKRDAVLALMSRHPEREFALSEIRAELIYRGELPDTKKAAHALQMTLLTLHEKGIVERVKQGVYAIARPEIPQHRFAALAAYGGDPSPIEIENGVLRPGDAQQAAMPTDLHRKEGDA